MSSNIAVVGKNIHQKNSVKNMTVLSKNKKIAIKFSIFAVIVAVLVAGSFGVSRAYKGKILPKVTIGGIKVGGKTPEQAQQLVKTYANQLNSKGPVINYNSKTFKPKLDEMGVTFDINKIVQEAYEHGRQDSFKTRFFENTRALITGYDVPITPQINDQKLDEYLAQIATVVEKKPTNAGLKIVNGQVITASAEKGLGLDKNKLKNDLIILINNGKTQGQIDLKTSDLVPSILEPGVLQAKIQAEKFMQTAPVTLTFENDTYVANQAEIGSWIEFQENGDILKAKIADNKLANYISAIAAKIEIDKIDKEIMDGTGQVLNEGQDGRGVDTKSLNSQIKAQLNSAKSGAKFAIGTFAVPKGETIIYPSAQPGRFAGRYLDINLSEQTMRLFDGNNLVGEHTVSTGKWSTPTPIGTRYIEDKNPRAWSAKYGLYMPFWNGIGGGYGIHELPEWPGGAKEGESHLGTPVSHGCIRLGVGSAEEVYNWAPIGTPVFIHE